MALLVVWTTQFSLTGRRLAIWALNRCFQRPFIFAAHEVLESLADLADPRAIAEYDSGIASENFLGITRGVLGVLERSQLKLKCL